MVYSKRLPNNLPEICGSLSPYLKDLFGVVVESTFNWYWLVDGLITAGHSVHLANTVAIKQYDGLKYRGDESDARHLAHILRLGLLPEGHIMPQPLRAVRDLSRKRMQLVQQRTTQLLSIGTYLLQQTGQQIGGDRIKQLTDADIDKMPVGAVEAIGMKANLAVMRALQTQIDGIEKSLATHCHGRPEYKLLNTVPGIGATLATVILLETGDVERFADVGNYASYCRCVSSVHISNGKKKGEGNAKNGNRYLAWAYIEAANFAIRFCEPARKFYQHKKLKRNKIIAIKAVAHKLARACYLMLKTGEKFSAERCFT